MCYIKTTVACKNRHHVICGLAHGGEKNFSEIVMLKEINSWTLAMAGSGINVHLRQFSSTPHLLVKSRRWPLAEKRHHAIFDLPHGVEGQYKPQILRGGAI